jgi:8-oxo-dGTP pyrophosphatase MutT (NUDIX family)
LQGAAVAAVFRWKEERERRTLELLFIRRSINERDTWSGQVAFPGGRRQKKTASPAAAIAEAGAAGGALSDQWETSLETATRETMEEIGLDLNQPYV